MSHGRIKGENKISMIPIFQISENKTQPRKKINSDDIRSLAKSIEFNGIIQPLIVRAVSMFEYELICGERRLRAAVMAGMSFVPCIIIHCSERQSMVYILIENLQREDLSYFEQADAIKKLIVEYDFTIETAAKQLGKTESDIKNKLKLLEYNDHERIKFIENGLSERYAYLLLMLQDLNMRKTVFNKVIDEKLSILDTEAIVNNFIKLDCSNYNHRYRIIIKDIWFFYNTIENAVSKLKHMGINATEEKTETDEFVEYRIRIIK